jgi:hypothetical protein
LKPVADKSGNRLEVGSPEMNLLQRVFKFSSVGFNQCRAGKKRRPGEDPRSVGSYVVDNEDIY